LSETVERFAPSPTGHLHLGHAYSAILAHDAARRAGGRFLLRIEDVDTTRSRDSFVQAMYDDLHWLGLSWDGAVIRQSDRRAVYEAALAELEARGLVYACTCSRKDIQAVATAPQEGGEVWPVYPGTCQGRARPEGAAPYALRLDMARALDALGGAETVGRFGYNEISDAPGAGQGRHVLDAADLVATAGDFVLSRKDGVIAYHLAVVVDDAAQEVTHVTRALDLASSTPVHRLLQALLSLPTPIYRHHRIIRDSAGKRLAKRDAATSLVQLRRAGATALDIRQRLGLG
jgi:glutamyl-Q tRNA(Asp) synthetase